LELPSYIFSVHDPAITTIISTIQSTAGVKLVLLRKFTRQICGFFLPNCTSSLHILTYSSPADAVSICSGSEAIYLQRREPDTKNSSPRAMNKDVRVRVYKV
jgi:hypothetical protein